MTTKERPMSDLMCRVLVDIADGRSAYHNCSGPSEQGGRSSTIAALLKRGYIDHIHQLTPAGEEWVALDRIRKKRPEADWSLAPDGTTHVMRVPGSEQVSWIKIVQRDEVYWRFPRNKNWRPSTSWADTLLSNPHVEPRPASC